MASFDPFSLAGVPATVKLHVHTEHQFIDKEKLGVFLNSFVS